MSALMCQTIRKMTNDYTKLLLPDFLFYVEIDEPVEPGKRKPPACFDNSHGSVANLGTKKCQIYYKPLDATINHYLSSI